MNARSQYFIERITGHAPGGIAQYAFLLVAAERRDALLAALGTQTTDIGRFGLILAHGTGEIPPGLEASLQVMVEKRQPMRHPTDTMQ